MVGIIDVKEKLWVEPGLVAIQYHTRRWLPLPPGIYFQLIKLG
jgi:hypothetical protein